METRPKPSPAHLHQTPHPKLPLPHLNQKTPHPNPTSPLEPYYSMSNTQLFLVSGNLPQSPATSLDKSDFVSEWCDDMIRQFMDGAPLASLPSDKIASSLVEKPVSILISGGASNSPPFETSVFLQLILHFSRIRVYFTHS